MFWVAPITKVINFGESRGAGHQELSCGFSKGFSGGGGADFAVIWGGWSWNYRGIFRIFAENYRG